MNGLIGYKTKSTFITKRDTKKSLVPYILKGVALISKLTKKKCLLNPFNVTSFFLYPLKTLDNL